MNKKIQVFIASVVTITCLTTLVILTLYTNSLKVNIKKEIITNTTNEVIAKIDEKNKLDTEKAGELIDRALEFYFPKIQKQGYLTQEMRADIINDLTSKYVHDKIQIFAPETKPANGIVYLEILIEQQNIYGEVVANVSQKVSGGISNVSNN